MSAAAAAWALKPKPHAVTMPMITAIQTALRMVFSFGVNLLSRRGRGRFRREAAGVALQFYPCVTRVCRPLTISLHRGWAEFGDRRDDWPMQTSAAEAAFANRALSARLNM